MTTPLGTAVARLSDAEVAQVVATLKTVDSVELKATIPVDAHRATIRGLPLDPVEAVPRQVYFFDTPELTPELRRESAFNVEIDVIPGGFVVSGSFKGRSTGDEIREVANGELRLSKVFSKDQRAFYAEHAPQGIELDSLRLLGPVFVLKGTFLSDLDAAGASQQRRIVAEMWLYPDGSRILEISLKCLPSEAFQVAAEARAWLHERGIELGPAQQTKTRAALDFFSKELQAAKS